VIDVLVDAAFRVSRRCQLLGVSPQGYYAYQRRPLSPTKMRREWLTALIREVHADSRGTYGSRRVHARQSRPPPAPAPSTQRKERSPDPGRFKFTIGPWLRAVTGDPS
jgi:hypothetical protein